MGSGTEEASCVAVIASTVGQLLLSPDWSTRVGALNVLNYQPRFGRVHVPRVLELACTDTDWTVRESACTCLSILAGLHSLTRLATVYTGYVLIHAAF